MPRYRWKVAIGIIIALLTLTANTVMHWIGFHPFLLAYRVGENPAIEYIRQTFPDDVIVMCKVPSFYLLRDYENFLAHRDGSVYGAILRGETMLDFWLRIQPQVILLEENEIKKDPELIQYLRLKNFTQLSTNLWVSSEIHYDP